MNRFWKNAAHIPLFLIVLGISACSSSLHKAAQEGNLIKMKSAISKGADVEDKDITGSIPLHIACEYGHLDSVKFLIKQGSDLNTKNSFFDTPLHKAAFGGHVDVIKFLISKGAKIHAKNNHGNTPLMIAAQEGKADAVKYLIYQGASVFTKNFYGETSKYLAKKNGHQTVVSILNNADRYRNRQEITFPQVLKDTTAPVITVNTPELSRGFKTVYKDSNVKISGTVIDESEIANVSVNDRKTEVDAQGNFSVDLYLQPGDNRILVTAVDVHGNQAFKAFDISRKEKELPYSKPTGKYHALLVGNNDYKHLPKLKTAENDATEVDKLLRETYGFETILLINASKTEISRWINRFRKKLNTDDSFLFYYAGHGYYDTTVNKAYWWPIDAEQDDDTNWIIADTITASIQRMASKHVLVVSDSCYSGTLTRSAFVNLKSGNQRMSFLHKMQQRPSRTLMASGGNEPVSDSGSGGHSVFAAAFIRALQMKNDQIFTAEELFHQHIKETVSGKSSQVPEYSIIRNSGHDGGDFIFIRQ